MSEPARYVVQEVHNFGGFFGGDTVTLTATQAGQQEEQTLTIDQQALANVRDRHTICAGMLLELTLAGDRVDRAELLGAKSYPELRSALGPAAPPPQLDQPLILSYFCEACQLWVAGAPPADACHICGASLAAAEA